MIEKFSLNRDKSVHQALTLASKFLESSGVYFGHGTDNAWDESVALLFWVMNVVEDPDESFQYVVLDTQTTEKFVDAVNIRVKNRMPAAYITGEAWFCGMRFIVDERVLVPRSPIAEMIQNQYQPWLLEQPKRILDLCCGSGCIGIAAAVFDPEVEVVLADVSADALAVAEKNLDLYDLHDRVSICQSDLFENLLGQKFDLILCNPPYVDSEDLASMPTEYLREPEIGLGSGADGLDLTRRILAQAFHFLNETGLLILEVGNSWVNLEQAFSRFPFTWIELANGGHGVCAVSASELNHAEF